VHEPCTKIAVSKALAVFADVQANKKLVEETNKRGRET
jgi:hypothetical protein